MHLRDVAERERKKKSYIFRSACGIIKCTIRKSSKIVKPHSSPTRERDRETLESHFLKASVFWLYKYQPSPLPSLWVSTFIAEREAETQSASYWHHKTPSLSHWSSFIQWRTGVGSSSFYQSETRGLGEDVTAPKRPIQMFSPPFARLTEIPAFWQQICRVFQHPQGLHPLFQPLHHLMHKNLIWTALG